MIVEALVEFQSKCEASKRWGYYFFSNAKTIWKGIDTRKRRILFELGINRVPLKWVCLLDLTYLHLQDISHPLKPRYKFCHGTIVEPPFPLVEFQSKCEASKRWGYYFFSKGQRPIEGRRETILRKPVYALEGN